MRCKFCGLETSTAICEYCGYDNVHGDNYDTQTITGENYKEPKLNQTNYGAESTAEHAAHAPYEDYIEDPTYEDYQKSVCYGEVEDTDQSNTYNNSFNWKQFHWWIFVPLLFVTPSLAFIYLFITIITGNSKK